MELINRYLQAVRFWLPRKQRDDIIAELSEEIRSQVEEGEREAGRKFTDPEIAEVLKRLGPPLTAAHRYLPRRSLIGPALFPVYVFVLKIVFTYFLLLQVVVLFQWSIGVAAAGGSWLAEAGKTLGSTWVSLLCAVGLATVIFAVIERVSETSLRKKEWDPLKLYPVRDSLRISRSSSIFEVVFSVLILAWWARYLGFQTIFELGGARITMDSSWVYFMGAFALVMLAQAALSWVNLIRPRWTVARSGLRLAVDAAAGVAFCWLLKAAVLREVVVAGAVKARTAGFAGAVNLGLSKALPYAVLVYAIIVLVDLRRIIRTKKGAR